MTDVAQVLADRRAEGEAEIAHLQRPADESATAPASRWSDWRR